MHNVFVKKNTEEQYIQLSDGRMMPLEKLVRDYERLLKKKSLKKVNTSKPKDNKSTVSKLKVGEWFRIDREIISNSENEIRCKCNEAGSLGVEYWKRFYASNVIANENPCQYPRLIETYVFEHSWKKKDAQEIEDMCKKVGEGICDEVICDLELQMRICNGESVTDLFLRNDKLSTTRIIKFRDGDFGFLGGGSFICNTTPATYAKSGANYQLFYKGSPYAFRRVYL